MPGRGGPRGSDQDERNNSSIRNRIANALAVIQSIIESLLYAQLMRFSAETKRSMEEAAG